MDLPDLYHETRGADNLKLAVHCRCNYHDTNCAHVSIPVIKLSMLLKQLADKSILQWLLRFPRCPITEEATLSDRNSAYSGPEAPGRHNRPATAPPLLGHIPTRLDTVALVPFCFPMGNHGSEFCSSRHTLLAVPQSKQRHLLNRSDQHLADNRNRDKRRRRFLSRIDRGQDGPLLATILRGNNTVVGRSFSAGCLGCR